MTSKTLIIGASGGIGNALVSRFADNGDEVIAVSRSGFVDSNWPDTAVSYTHLTLPTSDLV